MRARPFESRFYEPLTRADEVRVGPQLIAGFKESWGTICRGCKKDISAGVLTWLWGDGFATHVGCLNQGYRFDDAGSYKADGYVLLVGEPEGWAP